MKTNPYTSMSEALKEMKDIRQFSDMDRVKLALMWRIAGAVERIADALEKGGTRE